MRVLAGGSRVDLVVRPTSTLSGERLPADGVVAGVVLAAPCRSRCRPWFRQAASSVPRPERAAPARSAPPLADVCTSPFAVAAAALSAARLSLASSIVQAATISASAAVATVDAYLTPCLISPSVWVMDGEQGKRRAAAGVRVGSSPRRVP